MAGLHPGSKEHGNVNGEILGMIIFYAVGITAVIWLAMVSLHNIE